MGHRPKRKESPEPATWIMEELSPEVKPRSMVLLGAGTFLSDLIDLARQHPEFHIAGILDPAPSLRQQRIRDLPVLGWLDELPGTVDCAVIGNAATPQGFDREAVFHILIRRGIHLPILISPFSQCSPEVTLSRGTVLLTGSSVEPGAQLGQNCLLGNHASVAGFAALPDHSIVPPGARILFDEQTSRQTPRPKSLAATLAREADSIQDIMRRINWASMEIILVVDEKGSLIGSVTDGDIRRGLLAGLDLDKPVSLIMNRNPVMVPLGTAHQDMLDIMRRRSIHHLPVVDNENRPIRLERMESVIDQLASGQGAIVMAGGLGARLRPLTNDTPKPLLPVGGKPILDHILDGLKKSGIDDVVISLNYLGDQIRERVQNGREYDLSVNYVTERERLGTAGALSLIKPRPRRPFLVMNGDLLTRMNFAKLLDFQRENRHDLVMCVRKHQTLVPYGVVDIHEGRITGLREKPVYEHFINAGIYVLDPSCIDRIPRNRYFDMTDLIQSVLDGGGTVGAFPIIEYWRDIGRPEDLKAAGHESRLLDVEPENTETPAGSIPMEALV
ncbi:MAG: sugar phosphate nucleotidyltransferase [Lentisphaerota bacterium]